MDKRTAVDDSLDLPYDPDPLKGGEGVVIRRRLECKGYYREHYGCSDYIGRRDYEHRAPDGTVGMVLEWGFDPTDDQTHPYLVQYRDYVKSNGTLQRELFARTELDRR